MNQILNFKLKILNFSKAFTLIELLVVISILGILAGLIVSNVSGVRERARDVQRKSDLNQIKDALKMYHNDYDDYPATGTDSTIKGCGTTEALTDCAWGGEFTKDATTYMKVLPKDSSFTDDSPVYYFYSRTDQDNFTLYAILENKSDSEISKSQAKCGGSVQYAYYVCSD